MRLGSGFFATLWAAAMALGPMSPAHAKGQRYAKFEELNAAQQLIVAQAKDALAEIESARERLVPKEDALADLRPQTIESVQNFLSDLARYNRLRSQPEPATGLPGISYPELREARRQLDASHRMAVHTVSADNSLYLEVSEGRASISRLSKRYGELANQFFSNIYVNRSMVFPAHVKSIELKDGDKVLYAAEWNEGPEQQKLIDAMEFYHLLVEQHQEMLEGLEKSLQVSGSKRRAALAEYLEYLDDYVRAYDNVLLAQGLLEGGDVLLALASSLEGGPAATTLTLVYEAFYRGFDNSSRRLDDIKLPDELFDPDSEPFPANAEQFSVHPFSKSDLGSAVYDDEIKGAIGTAFELWFDRALGEEIKDEARNNRTLWSILKKLQAANERAATDVSSLALTAARRARLGQMLQLQDADWVRRMGRSYRTGFLTDDVYEILRRNEIIEMGKGFAKTALTNVAANAAVNAGKQAVENQFEEQRLEAAYRLATARMRYLLVHHEADEMFRETLRINKVLAQSMTRAGEAMEELGGGNRQLVVSTGDEPIELERNERPLSLSVTMTQQFGIYRYLVVDTENVADFGYYFFDDKEDLADDNQLLRANVSRRFFQPSKNESGTIDIRIDGRALYGEIDGDPSTIAKLEFSDDSNGPLSIAGYEKITDKSYQIKISAPQELALVAVRHSPKITLNGRRENLVMETTGRGQLPFTATLGPANCPSGVNCVTEQFTFEDLSPNGEYEWPGALWCTGAGPGFPYKFEVFITDATGYKTAKRPVIAVCAP